MATTCWDIPYDDDQVEIHRYGNPISGKVAVEQFGKERSSTPITVIIHRDSKVKPNKRRGNPELTAKEFFSSLCRSSDGRWFFSGILNHWGGLKLLELSTLHYKKPGSDDEVRFWPQPSEKSKKLSFAHIFRRNSVSSPGFPTKNGVKSVTATMFLPRFADLGYSQNVPGYVFYYTGAAASPKFSHGSNVMEAASQYDSKRHGALPKATIVHHFGHRYAVVDESEEDRRNYHTGLLIEWDHGEYGTIVELAWRHGLGGYRGQSNFYPDKLRKPYNTMYNAMPAMMKRPFVVNKSEIRVMDVPMKNGTELMAFLEKYTGPEKRFLDPQIKFSAKIALKNRTKVDICRHLVNRICFHNEYDIPNVKAKYFGHNCQTFSASFYGFLTNGDPTLFSVPLNVSERRDWFLTSHVDGSLSDPDYEE